MPRVARPHGARQRGPETTTGAGPCRPDPRENGVDSSVAADATPTTHARIDYIIPPPMPMPPMFGLICMPPPPAGPGSSGLSATMASVVRMFLAIDAAF